MKKVRFTKNHDIYGIGTVAGFRDSKANLLIANGVAVEVNPAVRMLKYAPTAPVSVECVQDTVEEIEAAPKGAVKQQTNTNTNKL